MSQDDTKISEFYLISTNQDDNALNDVTRDDLIDIIKRLFSEVSASETVSLLDILLEHLSKHGTDNPHEDDIEKLVDTAFDSLYNYWLKRGFRGTPDDLRNVIYTYIKQSDILSLYFGTETTTAPTVKDLMDAFNNIHDKMINDYNHLNRIEISHHYLKWPGTIGGVQLQTDGTLKKDPTAKHSIHWSEDGDIYYQWTMDVPAHLEGSEITIDVDATRQGILEYRISSHFTDWRPFTAPLITEDLYLPVTTDKDASSIAPDGSLVYKIQIPLTTYPLVFDSITASYRVNYIISDVKTLLDCVLVKKDSAGDTLENIPVNVNVNDTDINFTSDVAIIQPETYTYLEISYIGDTNKIKTTKINYRDAKTWRYTLPIGNIKLLRMKSNIIHDPNEGKPTDYEFRLRFEGNSPVEIKDVVVVIDATKTMTDDHLRTELYTDLRHKNIWESYFTIPIDEKLPTSNFSWISNINDVVKDDDVSWFNKIEGSVALAVQTNPNILAKSTVSVPFLRTVYLPLFTATGKHPVTDDDTIYELFAEVTGQYNITNPKDTTQLTRLTGIVFGLYVRGDDTVAHFRTANLLSSNRPIYRIYHTYQFYSGHISFWYATPTGITKQDTFLGDYWRMYPKQWQISTPNHILDNNFLGVHEFIYYPEKCVIPSFIECMVHADMIDIPYLK